MKGFKDFIMRGNLIELAVAFVVGAAFATVVQAFTTMFMDLLGLLGGTPDFSSFKPAGVSVGAFLTALVAFLIIATVVYFGVVLPYTKAKERFAREEADAPALTKTETLLEEIRDALTSGRP
ncbi:mechanosensitive ion channel protein MscL [Tessaracoccus lapidicaptus]|uniref:Mechanosensitive ion channel protein MscL n=1 Tax=Tessaracoccus lapidicaptus TaxID=1427523 RepID=A0A1C0APN7_9ACTN|nr:MULTISPECIES: large conductance mechanosensitive channel protein MscL [Tessaracoccus]AQX15354.1 mechanosensitive ion channel protein MscL [Tessaracoccus sp. T2.5-30]OCL36323.1 mechanosensitive ion channel protein MscL [Tessaracoccus lapidicaptus]VEP39644.1 Large-conductance mechanosensitive channel [Tessaracoccus lapidicaptus]